MPLIIRMTSSFCISMFTPPQIEGMELALLKSSTWTHFINLSGQDFPLRPRTEMVAQLGLDPETNFVDWFDPFGTGVWGDVDQRIRRRHLHFSWLYRLLHIPGLGRRLRAAMGCQNSIPYIPGYRRPAPDFFRYFGGSNHAMIARRGCEYLIRDPKARRIRRWLAATAIPDESTFQSVLLNGPYAATVTRKSGHFFEFVPDNPHPVIFRAIDFDRLIATGAYFARKFDTTIDPTVLDLIEGRLHAGK